MANRGVNKVIIVGNLGQNPEVRYMPNGGAVTNIIIATSENWRDKNTGEIKEKTEWHRVVLFGKMAEIAGEYLRKGSQVYIEGSIHTRKWQDQNGQERYTTEVVVNVGGGGSMQMLGGRQISSGSNNTNSSNVVGIQHQKNSLGQLSSSNQNNSQFIGSQASYNVPSAVHLATQAIDNESPIDFDDDIPF